MTLTRPSLLLRLKTSGDSDSWKEFAATYTRVVNDYARPYGQCEDDQNDIVQNVWVVLCRLMPRFQYHPHRGGFRHLLRRIVKNTAIDWFRRRGAVRFSNEAVEQTASRSVTAEMAGEQWSILQRALDLARRKSSVLAWNCFEKHVLERQSARDVGQVLGLSSNAVYVNASRVLDRVRVRCIELEKDAQHD